MSDKENEYVGKMTVAMESHPAFNKTQVSGAFLLRSFIYSLCRLFFHFSYEWGKTDFECGVALGKGKFGRVYIAREKLTGFMVAMKIMFKSELKAGRVEKQVLREIEIQSRLK